MWSGEVRAAAIVVSSLLDLLDKGVAVVGDLPSAFPDPALPDISWDAVIELLPAALGTLIVSAEAASVSRGIARAAGDEVGPEPRPDRARRIQRPGRLASGFVQSGVRGVRAPALERLRRAGLAERIPVEPSLDAAVD